MEINFFKLILKINLRFFNDGNNFQLNANKIFECDGHFNFLMHTSTHDLLLTYCRFSSIMSKLAITSG